MMVLPPSKSVSLYLKKHNLLKKYQKQVILLEKDLKHPSLNTERLYPKERGIYSFRLDRSYRVLFIYRDDIDGIEVIAITRHYD